MKPVIKHVKRVSDCFGGASSLTSSHWIGGNQKGSFYIMHQLPVIGNPWGPGPSGSIVGLANQHSGVIPLSTRSLKWHLGLLP